MRLIFLLIILLRIIPVGAQEEAQIPQEIQVGDLTRTYLIHYPAGYDPEKTYPTVIFFHGSGGSSLQAESSSGFDVTADEYGYIMVYPDGWEPGWDENSNNESIDDMEFTRLLIHSLIDHHSADPARIYMSGFSNGGMMALMAACKFSELVRGVGVMGSIYTSEMIRPCADAKPMPIMIFLGTEDRAFPWNGLGEGYGYLSANQTGVFWFGLLECENASNGDVPTTEASPHLLFVTHLFNCVDETEVLIYGVQDGTHTPFLQVEVMLDDGTLADRNDLFMQFFDRHGEE
jgi:polyhydroxybutyrate depolymerase